MGIERRTIEEAREIVEKYTGSGLSKKEFCSANGVDTQTLQWLQVRLRRYKQSALKKAESKTAFTCIELPAQEQAVSIKVSIDDINIELPENFKTSEFRKILTTIKSCHV